MTRLLPFLLLCLPALSLCAAPAITPELLAQALKKYPAADANGDGVLSLDEAKAYLAKMREQKAKPAAGGLAPTLADVRYGPRERDVMDVWQAKSGHPAPAVMLIHGGGFVAGDKSSWRNNPIVKDLVGKGVTCVAINYPFRDQEPIQDILHDAARAVQFVRSKATEWNIDKTRIASMGGSAGAGTSLWLTTRDDLADPNSTDPILRESSRVCACVCNATQATYDVTRWEGFLGKPDPAWARPEEGPAFYGLKDMAALMSEKAKPILKECDMLGWISKDDGPIYCTVNRNDGPIQNRGEWLHHPKHAQEIHKVCDATGVNCTVTRDGGREETLAFLLRNLKVGESE
jgi:hypothetical protein